MTLISHQLRAAVRTVASLAVRHGDSAVVVMENAQRVSPRGSLEGLAEVSACVLAKGVREPWQRAPLYALRILLWQPLEALWCGCSEERGAERDAIGHETTKAWAHLASAFSAVALSP